MARLWVSLFFCRVSAGLCFVADCVLESVVFPLALTGFAVVRAALQLLVGRVVGRASRRRFVTPTLCARAFRGRPRSARRLRTPFLCQGLDLSYDGGTLGAQLRKYASQRGALSRLATA